MRKLSNLFSDRLLGNAKINLVYAENYEKAAQIKLNQVLGLNLNTDLKLTKQLAYSLPPEITIDEAAASAPEKRFDTVQARESVNLKIVEYSINRQHGETKEVLRTWLLEPLG